MAEVLPLVIGTTKKVQEIQSGDTLCVPATLQGQIMYSTDGVKLRPETPLISDHGHILVNDSAQILVSG